MAAIAAINHQLGKMGPTDLNKLSALLSSGVPLGPKALEEWWAAVRRFLHEFREGV